MLDISIQNLEKSSLNYEDILDNEWTIEEKYDGTKIHLLRNKEPFDKKDFSKNWIISYKGSIMYEEEFSNIERVNIKEHSIGISQYALVFDHMKRIHQYTGLIPINTEFFIEFIMNKPTLTRKYKKYHDLVLIDSQVSSYKVNINNNLTTDRLRSSLKDRSFYTKQLGIKFPRKLINGKLFPFNILLESTIDIELRNHLSINSVLFNNFVNKEQYFYILKNVLLSFESEFGNKMEGIILTDQKHNTYKILQTDQHDKQTRQLIKQKYKGSKEEETHYYQSIYKIATQQVNTVDKKQSFIKKLNILAGLYKKNFSSLEHSKKNEHQIKDDIYLTAKIILTKSKIGNNGALFVGRFDPPTKKHIQIVEKCLVKFDYVIIGIVNKNKLIDVELTKKMWREICPNIEIIEAKTGNLIRFLDKTNLNVNTIIAGSDRVESYQKQLKHNPLLNIKHISRLEDISATQIRVGLMNNDIEKVNQNLDKRHRKYIKELEYFF